LLTSTFVVCSSKLLTLERSMWTLPLKINLQSILSLIIVLLELYPFRCVTFFFLARWFYKLNPNVLYV
jgi:hypothetical protein